MEKTMRGLNTIPPIFDVEDDRILKPDEIAKMLEMSVESVRRWCRSGKITAFSFGGQYAVLGCDFKIFILRSRMRSKAEKILHG